MAFKFNWTTFDKSFIDEAQDKLTEALNKGIKTQMIGNIKVKELNMGTKAPDLEVMEIGDLSEEKFKGIFKITYQGDAYLVIQTIVQINPLVIPKTPITLSVGGGVVAADQPLPIPIKLRISNLKLSGIAALGFSNKGITFCFKNDPLENINVSSTFDHIPAIKKIIENIIKTQISAFLLEDVPGLIHNFSNNSVNVPNGNNHNRSYSNDTTIPASPISYSSSIYGEEDDDIFSSNQTLIAEENDIMDWKRKWIGNDLNSNSSFQNKIILYRGLKCSKYVNANRGILRLLNPSFNNYLCQSIHIDSWLITPPFSPIPLYIPKASYPSYTKDKHFSIVDYLRRTAITRVPQSHKIGNDVNNFDINNNSEYTIDNPFKRLQQQSLDNIPSSSLSSISTPPISIASTSVSDKSILFSGKSSGDLSNNNHHHGYNYTHTYHRGQRKSKSVRKNKLSLSNSSLSNNTENESLYNSSKTLINIKDEEIPSSALSSLSATKSGGHVRAYSNQTNITETSNNQMSSVIPQNNGTISSENVFLSLLNNNTNGKSNGCTSVNIYSRNNNNINNSNNMINNSNNGNSNTNNYGESTVCEEFPAEIVIEPSNNSMAAQLTNLMNSNQTISPYTRTLEHFAYRSFPHSKSNYKRRYHRQRHRLKIHVDGLMSSSSSSTRNESNNQSSATS
ncbi:hypothetical protein H8356DRAFT_1059329 [Neocallimastix lanati (nom. inval.)]|nr:hypothetical protein H8356DRAFT_1059329 [Neocallimastix sp. JGI-2020a]